MVRAMCIIVCDDRETIEKMKSQGHQNGLEVQAYTGTEWKVKMSDPNFVREISGGSVPSLASGSQPLESGAKILQFPQGNVMSNNDGKVQTINEMEAVAIESAIHEFNGNLTEAAKALGIGRATLYRKVKQYNIDPSAARRRRAA